MLKIENHDFFILLAHGSRDKTWKTALTKIITRLKEESGVKNIGLAYLDLSEPNLENMIARMILRGRLHFTILPLFMSGGGHVTRDVPRVIARIKKKHPHLKIRVLRAIGDQPEFAEMLCGLINRERS